MSELTCLVRPTAIVDSRAIWEIRFHPTVATTTLTSEPTPFAKHDVWFKKKYFGEVKNFCWVLECSNQVTGYCRCDLDSPSVYVVSIALDPNWHGQGLGKKFLAEALSKMPKGIQLRAEIKKNNSTSLNLFKSQGFKQSTATSNTFVLIRQL